MGRASGRTVWRGIDDQDRCGPATDARGTAASARRVYVQYVDRGKERGAHRASALYERRFSPEFKVAFDAWLATRPFANPDAPPGPSFMPEYVNPQIEKGLELNERGDRVFDEGTAARGRADDYIRTTVVLATVLFMLALSQRFNVLQIRVGVLVVAGGLMIYGLVAIATFPRL
jgi:hypothetical protein